MQLPSRSLRSLLLLSLLACLVLPASSSAQGAPNVVIETRKTAFRKIDILVGELEVLSGGRRAADSAVLVRDTLVRDLDYSGFFRPGDRTGQVVADGDTLDYEFTIEGVFEGRFHCDLEQKFLEMES